MSELDVHRMSRARGKGTDPQGYTDWEQVVCTCGYKSPQVANYNNDKLGMLLVFEQGHLKRERLKADSC